MSFPPNTHHSKKTPALFPCLLLSDLFLFCSFILSHPLYFSYFIFFSPYILKILSFLSPLFITTFLLLVSLLTTLLNDGSSDGDDHEEFQQFEEALEAYKMVFEASTLELLERGSVEGSGSGLEEPDESDQMLTTSHESLADITRDVVDESVDEEKEKEVVKAPSVESNKGEEASTRSGSKALSEVKESGAVESLVSSKVRSNSQRHDDNGGSLGNFGSMRKEKEWKRTLACKLFEERHSVNVDGGAEGMDLLWETYETDSNKVLSKSKTNKGKKHYHDDDNEDDDDDDDDGDGQLCCLQALKFSAGKMNLGMGRPNLVKISKALKGFGWLHHVTKHGSKKVHP